MERVSVLCLFLLCSLSGAELLNNEIIEEREARPESVNAPEQPQPCPSDVHAVLREMSVKLAVLQTKMELMEKENQEQAAKLREVDMLNQQLQAQATDLNVLKSQTNVTEKYVEALRRDRAVGQVAFSAALSAGEVTMGPINSDYLLVFKYVMSNIGNAYNPYTGLFTVPVRGAYHFELYVGAKGQQSHKLVVDLVKNGEHIVTAWEDQTSGFAKSANGVTLLLEAGDAVFVRLRANTVIYNNERRHSTFSGHLLFPM